MARRQARRPGARQPEPLPRRATSASGGWKHWLMIAFVGLMAVILIVTMLPPL